MIKHSLIDPFFILSSAVQMYEFSYIHFHLCLLLFPVFFVPRSFNTVRSSTCLRSVGRIPNSFVAESSCKWVDMRGRQVSPPPGVDSNGRILSGESIHMSDLRLLGDDDERKVC